MSNLEPIVAAHPLQEQPYNKIGYIRTDGQNTPLYCVLGETKQTGAREALNIALRKFGGTCFHCKKKFKPQSMSQSVNRDHMRPMSKGGGNYLHNLVISCGECNRSKGNKAVTEFKVERGADYLKALDAHIVRCIKAFEQTEKPNPPSSPHPPSQASTAGP